MIKATRTTSRISKNVILGKLRNIDCIYEVNKFKEKLKPCYPSATSNVLFLNSHDYPSENSGNVRTANYAPAPFRHRNIRRLCYFICFGVNDRDASSPF